MLVGVLGMRGSGMGNGSLPKRRRPFIKEDVSFGIRKLGGHRLHQQQSTEEAKRFASMDGLSAAK